MGFYQELMTYNSIICIIIANFWESNKDFVKIFNTWFCKKISTTSSVVLGQIICLPEHSCFSAKTKLKKHIASRISASIKAYSKANLTDMINYIYNTHVLFRKLTKRTCQIQATRKIIHMLRNFPTGRKEASKIKHLINSWKSRITEREKREYTCNFEAMKYCKNWVCSAAQFQWKNGRNPNHVHHYCLCLTCSLHPLHHSQCRSCDPRLNYSFRFWSFTSERLVSAKKGPQTLLLWNSTSLR